MRTLFVAVLLSWIGIAPTHAQDTGSPPLRVVTWNIRFDNPADGPDAWLHRRSRVAHILDSLDADVAGLQEALVGQIRFLNDTLSGYAWIGVGRDDGREAGEFSPILYRPDRLELHDWGTVWLSDTPDSVGSVGWDAALPRIATWARFRPRSGGDPFVVVNTHFDHVGTMARRRSADLIRSRFAAGAAGAPLVLLGDFNVVDTTRAYEAIVSGPAGLVDAWRAAGSPEPAGTFTGFDGSDDRRIDYVFASTAWRVRSAHVVAPERRGRYPSDHRPVTAVLTPR